MRYRDLAAALDARIPATQWLVPGNVDDRHQRQRRALVTVTAATSRGRSRPNSSSTPKAAESDPRSQRRDRPARGDRRSPTGDAARQPRLGSASRQDGPLALLPLGQDYSVVFTVPPEKAEHDCSRSTTLASSPPARAVRHRASISSTGPRAAYPLALRVRRQTVQPRQVWIGNARRRCTRSPDRVSTFGLRDAVGTRRRLLDGRGTKQTDVGHPAALAAYARGRQLDRRGSMVFTDGIVRLFSNDLRRFAARGSGALRSISRRRCATSSPNA